MFMGAGLFLVAAGAGCGGDDPPVTDDMTKPVVPVCTADKVTGTSNKLATDSLKLPKTTGGSTYAYDFDGDGKQENQLKNLVNVISLSGLNIQDSVDMAVQGGQAIILADIKTPDLMTSMCSSLTFSLADAPAMGAPKPKFDGTDTFKVGGIAGVTLFGGITAGKLSTIASKDQTAANEQKITLNLPLGMGTTLPLSLRGAHIEGSLVMEAGVLKIKNGAIHGVLAKKDIDEQIVPLVASLLTDLIQKDVKMGMPGDTAKAIIGLFEQKNDAKCMANMNDCCATHIATCKITKEEVLASPIGGVLAPDVQVLDEAGNWKPVAGGKMVNGMSVGLGFSSVKASF
jgi:hypothetical protein